MARGHGGRDAAVADGLRRPLPLDFRAAFASASSQQRGGAAAASSQQSWGERAAAYLWRDFHPRPPSLFVPRRWARTPRIVLMLATAAALAYVLAQNHLGPPHRRDVVRTAAFSLGMHLVAVLQFDFVWAFGGIGAIAALAFAACVGIVGVAEMSARQMTLANQVLVAACLVYALVSFVGLGSAHWACYAHAAGLPSGDAGCWDA